MIITAKERELGTKAARKLRRNGKVPGVIYGINTDNRHIEMDKLDLLAALRKSRRNDKFEVEIEGKDKFEVIVKQIQWHPVTEDIRHIDFYKLTEGKTVTLNVPVVVTGEAKGVKLGGDLYQPRKRIMIEALPESIPNEITVDVTDLNIGDVVHVFDLDIPEGVKVKSTKNFTVVAVLGKSQEEEEIESEEEEEEEIEVE
jgi:large subunit ribosomal protein L25